MFSKERLAGNKFGEICVCVSPTQAKMYAIKPKIPETYYQPDALYQYEIGGVVFNYPRIVKKKTFASVCSMQLLSFSSSSSSPILSCELN